jgi:hypothetical protein
MLGMMTMMMIWIKTKTPKFGKSDATCGKCFGTGWAYALRKGVLGVKGDKNGHAQRCDCQAGDRRREKRMAEVRK